MEVCKDLQPSQALLLFELIAYAWNNRQSRKEWFRDKNKSYSSCNQSYSSCNRRRGNKTGTGSSLTNYAPSKKEIKVCFYSNRKGGENLLVRPKKHTGQSSFINAAFVGVPFEGKKKITLCTRLRGHVSVSPKDHHPSDCSEHPSQIHVRRAYLFFLIFAGNVWCLCIM